MRLNPAWRMLLLLLQRRREQQQQQHPLGPIESRSTEHDVNNLRPDQDQAGAGVNPSKCRKGVGRHLMTLRPNGGLIYDYSQPK